MLAAFMPRSATLARLVATVRASALVVHVVEAEPAGSRWDGTTRFVAAAGGCRYARIALRAQSDAAATAALLAHELQHAVEIVDGDIWDREAFAAWFARTGFPVPAEGAGAFDTDAARRAGVQAWREITSRGTRIGHGLTIHGQ